MAARVRRSLELPTGAAIGCRMESSPPASHHRGACAPAIACNASQNPPACRTRPPDHHRRAAAARPAAAATRARGVPAGALAWLTWHLHCCSLTLAAHPAVGRYHFGASVSSLAVWNLHLCFALPLQHPAGCHMWPPFEPTCNPQAICDLMLQCLNDNPQDRPTAQQVRAWQCQ